MTAGKGSLQQIQAAELLHALMQQGIDSRESLAKTWRKEPVLLQRHLLECLRKGKRQTLMKKWPQVLAEAFQVAD